MKNDISDKIDSITIIKAKTGFIISEQNNRDFGAGLVPESHGLTTAFDVQEKVRVWTEAKSMQEVE